MQGLTMMELQLKRIADTNEVGNQIMIFDSLFLNGIIDAKTYRQGILELLKLSRANISMEEQNEEEAYGRGSQEA